MNHQKNRKPGPIHADRFASAGLFGRHGGQELNFKLARPVELTWRVGRYHTFGMRFFRLVRDGQLALQRERTIRDVTFLAGEQLQTDLETSVLRLDYGFAVTGRIPA